MKNIYLFFSWFVPLFLIGFGIWFTVMVVDSNLPLWLKWLILK